MSEKSFSLKLTIKNNIYIKNDRKKFFTQIITFALKMSEKSFSLKLTIKNKIYIENG